MYDDTITHQYSNLGLLHRVECKVRSTKITYNKQRCDIPFLPSDDRRECN